MPHMSFLWASLLWSSVGLGYFVYGKRQQVFSAMSGGVLLMAGSYFISSALWMSLGSLAIMAAVFWLTRRGY